MSEIKLNTPLTINEIDFRIQSINKGGYATILPYKDARVDMNRLDAVYGVGFWQKKYDLINDNLFCSVGIWNSNIQQWVWVQDVGTESFAEKEKGQASDAFKRACFNLGIGREIYGYPLIKVKLNSDEYEIVGDKVKQTYHLNLKDWKWESNFDENGKICFLKAIDKNNSVRFQYMSSVNNIIINKSSDKEELTPEHKHWISAKYKLSNGQTTIDKLRSIYDISKENEELLTRKIV